MTDEQFIEFCSEHPDLRFETTADGESIVMAPTYLMTGARRSPDALRGKMCEYLENGAALDWLINPDTRSVEICRPYAEPDLLTGVDSVTCEGRVAEFVLEPPRRTSTLHVWKRLRGVKPDDIH